MGAGLGQVVAEVPGQKDAGVNDDPLHMGPAHMAVEFWHLPVPSHVLVTPHGLVAPQRVSVEPLDFGWHVPLPSTLHALQAGQLELPQQTLSTQLPLLHSLPELQATPGPLRLQLFVPPTPGWQVLGGRQSLSAVHDVLQVVAPHWNGEQLMLVAVAHVPVPVQCDDGVYMSVEALHISAPHDVFVLA